MMRRHWRGLPILGILAAVGCNPPPDKTENGPPELPTVTVTVAPVEIKPVRRTVATVGTLNGYDQVILAPKVGGRIARIRVDVGDRVAPGEVLLELDPVDMRNEVDRAKRALELELAKLDLPLLVSKEDFKPETVPAVIRAQATWFNAEREYKRVQSTAGASDRELRAAETEFKLAAANKSVALSEANAGLTAAWLKKDELDNALQRLADCVLRTPEPTGWAAWAAALGTAGTPIRYAVYQRLVSEGMMAQAMPLTESFKLVLDFVLKLRVAVPERYSGEITIGRPAEVRVDAFPDKVFLGSIVRMNPTIDPFNRTFQVEIQLANLDGRLKSGGFARAELLARVDPAVKTVPLAALLSYAGVTKVFVIENAKARAIVVKTGARDKDWAEVIGPIPDGAVVATSGFSQMVDGSPVIVR